MKNDSPYWGEDRRRAIASVDGSTLRPILATSVVLVAAWIAALAYGGLAAERGAFDAELLQALLEAAAAAFAIVLALLCVVRRRLVGEAAGVWAGAAFIIYGTVTVAFTGLVPLVLGGGADPTVAWMRPASRLVVLGFLLVALVGPAVDERLRLWRLLAGGVSAVAVLTVLFQLAPPVGLLVTTRADAFAGAPVGLFGPTLAVALYAGLAAGLLLRCGRERRPLLGWLAVLVASLALAEVTRIVAAEGEALWSAGAQLVRLVGLGAALYGATLELQRAYQFQARTLMQSVVSNATAQARIVAGRQEVEERAHEARNALQAIEAASTTLERHRDSLDVETRASLATAVSAEIGRLQRLISADHVQDDAVFPVAEALAPVVTGARANGTGVLVDIGEDLTAYGRWADTAEVVQNLIENARRHAAGSPVAVRARRQDDRVLIRVEDRGPGVPAEQRDAIFRRGVRGRGNTESPGSGLGLYVSRRLMRDQGGDLWLEERPGGGSVFVAALPAGEGSGPAAVDDVAGRPVEERVEVVDALDDDRFVTDSSSPDARGLG